MTEDTPTGETAPGPICPNCRVSLRNLLRRERITPTTSGDPVPPLPVALVFCGSCGWTLDVAPLPIGMPSGFAPDRPGMEEVVAPTNEESLQGQFQMRCRDLITQTRELGFNPNVWVDMVNRIGALETAKKLLADHHVLVATPWLVSRGRADLTIEHEIGLTRWTELFSDEDRAEAADRLSAAGRAGPD